MASWVKTSQCAGNSSCFYTCVTVITAGSNCGEFPLQPVQQSLLLSINRCYTITKIAQLSLADSGSRDRQQKHIISHRYTRPVIIINDDQSLLTMLSSDWLTFTQPNWFMPQNGSRM